MTEITADKIRVLRAVRCGAATPLEVAVSTGLSIERVMAAAAILRGNDETPELLCCLDGDPWALTLAGARLLVAL